MAYPLCRKAGRPCTDVDDAATNHRDVPSESLAQQAIELKSSKSTFSLLEENALGVFAHYLKSSFYVR